MTGLDPTFVRLHEDAHALLASWPAPDPAQGALRDDYLRFLDEHPDALTRECRVGHLTASALVVDRSRRNVLLTLHPKAGRWLQLGGHCEVGDASLRDAAIRETMEEGGIVDVDMSALPLHIDRHPVKCWGDVSEHLDVQFLAVVPDGSEAVISDESDDLRWFAIDALPQGLDDAVLAMIAAAAPARQVNGG